MTLNKNKHKKTNKNKKNNEHCGLWGVGFLYKYFSSLSPLHNVVGTTSNPKTNLTNTN